MTVLIDLTLTLGGNRVTPVPGLIGFATEPIHTHQSDSRSNTKLTLATHLGTHVDAPYHFHPNGQTIDNIPLEHFTGPALLLDLRKLALPKVAIAVEDLQQAGGQAGALNDIIVVLFTGWAEVESGRSRFYTDGPYLSIDAAEYLVRNRVNALAVDFPIDKHPPFSQSTPEDFPVHRLLLGQNIPIIENLINLHKLVGRKFDLWALPLKLMGGDGAATRAVAQIH
jgi:arylformamidase